MNSFIRRSCQIALSPSASASRPIAVEVVGLDPVEVVLGLGVDHPEHGVGVGLAVDVGDAPVVPDDRDARAPRAPSGREASRVRGAGAWAIVAADRSSSRECMDLVAGFEGGRNLGRPGAILKRFNSLPGE